MNAHQIIAQALKMAQNVMATYVSDLSDEEIKKAPAEGCNPLAHQLGHLICTEHKILEAIKPGSTPDLPAAFEQNHALSQETPRDPSNYLPVKDYLNLYNAHREATLGVLENLTDADLEKDAPESLRSFAPTAADAILMMASHDMMHSGQFVVCRRQFGKEIKI